MDLAGAPGKRRAGKMLGFDADRMVNAIGIAGSHNHTIGCPTAGKLTMMKNTVDPMAVQAGVFAALMAGKGYSGTEAVFQGKEGFMDCFMGWDVKSRAVSPVRMQGRDTLGEWSWDVGKLTGGLGSSYKILERSMKAFPTEALTHTHLSCVLKLVVEHGIASEEIEEVTVTTIARACDILFDPHKYRLWMRQVMRRTIPGVIGRMSAEALSRGHYPSAHRPSGYGREHPSTTEISGVAYMTSPARRRSRQRTAGSGASRAGFSDDLTPP